MFDYVTNTPPSTIMYDKPISRFRTTDDALKLFFPGQKVLLKPLNSSKVSFTVCKLSIPVTKSVVVLAKPDMGGMELVVIKIYDPRYLDERIAEIPSHPSYPWSFTNEQAAAMARPQNSKLSKEELRDIIYDWPGSPNEEELATHCLFWEEKFYRLMMNSYGAELAAYERLKDLQGSTIPRLIMTGRFLPPDKRAIQPPALVLEYVPSVNLHDADFDVITPAIYSQLLSDIESFPSHGVIHNDITLTNIHLTPPEKPVRAILLDFGLAIIRCEEHDEETWMVWGASDARWAGRLLQDKNTRDPAQDERVSRFR